MPGRLQTSAPQNLVDYFPWHHPAGVVFINLVELASLHEISQLTDVEKQQLRPNAPVLSFWVTLSIVALEEEGIHAHV